MFIGEYLNTTNRPDKELLDGHLAERNTGEYDHSNLHGAIVSWMRSHQREWNIHVLPEQRIQVSSTRFRVPGVCIIPRDQQPKPVFTQAPLMCIEILSKDDTLRSIQDWVDDYRAFGVPHICVLDPVKRRAYVATLGDFREPEYAVLEIPLSPIRIFLNDLFSD